MTTLSEFLQPYYVLFKLFGIVFEESTHKTMEKIGGFFRRLFTVIAVTALAPISYFLYDIYSRTRNLKNEFKIYDIMFIIWLTTGIAVLSNSISLIFVYFKHNPKNFNMLKLIKLSSYEVKQLSKRCHFLLVFSASILILNICSTAIIHYSSFANLIEENKNMTKDVSITVIEICVLSFMKWFAFYTLFYPSYCCLLMYVISQLIQIRLKTNIDELNCIKSPMKMIKKLDDALQEYENMRNLAKVFDDLFSPIILFIAISRLMSSAVLLACSDFNAFVHFYIGDFHSHWNFIYFVIYTCSAIKVNALPYQFSKCLASHLVMDKKLPIYLSTKRLDQLYQLIHLTWFSDDMFTMTSYVKLDETLLFSVFQQIFDMRNAMASVPLKASTNLQYMTKKSTYYEIHGLKVWL
ncbi:hypothetical protein CHUAL_008071 [Chamberlinius hualienensis]